MNFFKNPQLVQASQNPPDLRKLLTPQRIDSFQAQAAGLKLFYATERVTDTILDALFSLAVDRKVISHMKAMQSGEKVNVIQGHESENRPALHTAMRDVSSAGKRSPITQAAVDLAKKEIEKLRAFLPEV